MKPTNPALLCLFVTTAAATSTPQNPFAGVFADNDTGPYTIVGVHTQFTVPTISVPVNEPATQDYGGQILLGLDTINCSSPITATLQFFLQPSHPTQYSLLYQWLSQPPVIVPSSSLAVKAGDSLEISINGNPYNEANPQADNASIYFQNLSSGKGFAVSTDRALPVCGKNVVIGFQPLGTDPVGKFEKIVMDQTYYAIDSGAVLHPASFVGAEVSNLTDGAGKTIVAAAVDRALGLNFTYAR